MSESISSKYKVPSNLRPLLEAFARETLRTQPADLIEFGRSFFETLHLAQKGEYFWIIYCLLFMFVVKCKWTLLIAMETRKVFKESVFDTD